MIDRVTRALLLVTSLSMLACSSLFGDDSSNDDNDDDSGGGGFFGDADTDSDADSDSDSDADTDADGDPMREPLMSWDSDGLTVNVKGVDGFSLGMAETGSPYGWYGEDCLEGQDGYQICHEFGSDSGFLLTVYDPDDVASGETTLFSSSLADGVTYIVFDPSVPNLDPTTCWYGGDDPGYYQDFGYDCAE